MANLGNTTRPAYVYDAETDTWLPIGVGAHSHDYTTQFIGKTLVDAKGDIVTASASDTPAILSKGADGTVLVSDSTTSTGLAWQPYGTQVVAGKNICINGGFDIWQRGTSIGSGTVHGYSADRWVLQRGGWASGATISRQAGLGAMQYCARVQRNSGNTDTGGINIQTSFETSNSIPFAGQVVTLSFWARAGANYSGGSNQLGCNVYSGTGTDQNTDATGFTGSTTPITSAVTLTTSWQKFIFNGTVPSNSTQLGMMFNYAPTGTAGVSDYFEITGIQLELGSAATPFSRTGGTIQGELAVCQRYYQRFTAGQDSSNNAVYNRLCPPGQGQGVSAVTCTVPFAVVMRIGPSSIDVGGSFQPYFSQGFISGGTWVIDATNKYSGTLNYLKNNSFTANGCYQIVSNNDSTSYIGFSAEL
jgi:hypothetical protein